MAGGRQKGLDGLGELDEPLCPSEVRRYFSRRATFNEKRLSRRRSLPPDEYPPRQVILLPQQKQLKSTTGGLVRKEPSRNDLRLI